MRGGSEGREETEVTHRARTVVMTWTTVYWRTPTLHHRMKRLEWKKEQ